MDKNYKFFMKTNMDRYIGQWVAICDQEIVASGDDLKKVFKKAKEKCPRKKPLITKVPEEETMIF